MRHIIFLITISLSSTLICQYDYTKGLFHKEFSKEQTEFLARTYMATEVLVPKETPQTFNLDAVTATESGQLTCLVYDGDCGKGLLLAFWGAQITEFGTNYNSYSFTHIPEEDAKKMLTTLQFAVNDYRRDNTSFTGNSNANVVFKIGDISFIIYGKNGTNIRVLWNGFESEWGAYELSNTKKKFERKLNIKN